MNAFERCAFLIFAAYLMLGCSSSSNAGTAAAGGDCPNVGSKVCQDDDAFTQNQVDQCNTAKGDSKCGGPYTDYLKCEGANAKCGSDHKTNGTALLQACSSQSDAYSRCKSGDTDGG